MNKTVNINLGGYPLTIDQDGYDFLEEYLDSLRVHFENTEDRHEIIEDIEARMAELLEEKFTTRRILSLNNIKEVVETMGYPKDFEDIQYEQVRDGHTVRTDKRLFRDDENKVIGGVCAGLAAYFGIADPIWVRLGFVFLFFGAGIGLIPYVILWILIPSAKTPADKIAMKGERINVSNITKNIEEDLDFLKQKLTDLGKEFKSKKGKKDELDDF